MEGIDVHGSKGFIDWPALRRQGISFAFVKATEGCTFFDSRIVRNLQGAKDAGILVGPYHYARPDIRPWTSGAVDEADYFCKSIQAAGYSPRVHGRPVLDIEVGRGNLSLWAETFCKRVEEKTGVKPIIYSYTYFIRSHLTAASLAAYPLWLANYGPNDGLRHRVTRGEGPWEAWTVHQYTSSGSLTGVSGRVDRNYAPSLEPLFATEPEAKPKPRRDTKAMWEWIRWYRGREEFKKFGPRNPDVRPNVPTRIPAKWWGRLLLNIFGRGGGGGKVKSQ